MFETPTVAGIAAALDEATGRSARRWCARSAPSWCLRRSRSSGCGSSTAWRAATPTYNVPWAIRLCGALDQDALGQALNDVVERHESLRTVFTEVDGVAVQQVRDMPAAGIELTAAQVAEDELAERCDARPVARGSTWPPPSRSCGPACSQARRPVTSGCWWW